MKRKLNENNVPEETLQTHAQPNNLTFSSLGLDARLLRGIAKEKWNTPTGIQAKSIPLALEGKDILAQSKTGSGKTGAYILPLLQAILKRKDNPNHSRCISALILVPTRELATQVAKSAESLSAFCSQDIRIENLTRKEDEKVQRARLADYPDIVIATPGRASYNLHNSALSLDNLTHLVIDEADLVLSYGYEEDLETLSKSIPKGVQTFLMSATLREEVELLKQQFCRNPILLSLEAEEESSGTISQYVVRCAEDEKFLLLYAICMLKLVKGKTIIFVGDIERCYRIKLFLEQFGVRSCVLNSELPINSRIHVVEEFNKGVYDIIVAADEHEVLGEEDESKSGRSRESISQAQVPGTEETILDSPLNNPHQVGKTTDNEVNEPKTTQFEERLDRSRKRRKGPKRDKEYGVARGIDFKNVACVLNFDLPTTSKSYTHRIGRTARAGNTGMALSFVVPLEVFRKAKPTSIRLKTAEHDESVLAKIEKSQRKRGLEIKPYNFDMTKLEGFRYRLGDAMRAVTREAIREARVRELRQELIKSEKLKRYFEENPTDLQHLRHDGELRAARLQQHLKHLPEYLLPPGGKKAVVDGASGFVGFAKDPRERNRIRRVRMSKTMKGRKPNVQSRKDPLKTFRATR